MDDGLLDWMVVEGDGGSLEGAVGDINGLDSVVGSAFSVVFGDWTCVSEGRRLVVELVKKGRGISVVIWNLETDENILCSQKMTWRDTRSLFEMGSQHL